MKKQHGFTLIELMIVVAVIAILAAVAWPSYQNQIRATNRSDAQGALLGLAQAMERHFTENGSYNGAGADGADGTSGAPVIFPAQSPLDGSNKSYNLTLNVTNGGASYQLFATPFGAQAVDGQLRLSSSGEKAWDRGNDGAFADPGDLCWNKTCN